MSKELEYLARVVSEKTPGDWWIDFPMVTIAKSTSEIADLSCGQNPRKDTHFIALTGTVAKEWLAVVEAAELVSQPQLHAKALDGLATKLESLKAKIKSQME